MEKKLYEMQAELCKTLSNPKRLEILDILKEREEISVNHLAEMLEIPKANTSQHLAVLRESHLVNTRRQAQTVFYSVAPGPVDAIIRTLHGIYCKPPAAGTARNKAD